MLQPQPSDPSAGVRLVEWINAVSTAVVAVFAFIQVRRESLTANARVQSANSRASAAAYRLRRRILQWFGQGEETDERALETWLRRTVTSSMRDHQLVEAEREISALVSESVDCSADVAAALNRSYVTLLEGLRRIRVHVDSTQPSGPEFFDWWQLLTDASCDLRDVIRELEQHCIAPGLLNAQTINARTRAAEEPFGQLAEAVIREEDERKLLERQHAIDPPKGADGA